jgi:hypothetical protein
VLRGFFDIIIGRSEPRNVIQRITLTVPLRRFNAVEDLGYFPLFKSIAKSLAKQTQLMVEELLCDSAIPDWAEAGNNVTPEQIMDLGTFCSQCLVQFTIKRLESASSNASFPPSLGADLTDLARVMYGDFAPTATPGAITFVESLQLRNLEDDVEIRDLTRFVDQLMGLDGHDNSCREAKIQKVRALFSAHTRVFAYRLHGLV